jgi:hypothetical protein
LRDPFWQKTGQERTPSSYVAQRRM